MKFENYFAHNRAQWFLYLLHGLFSHKALATRIFMVSLQGCAGYILNKDSKKKEAVGFYMWYREVVICTECLHVTEDEHRYLSSIVSYVGFMSINIVREI